MFKLNSHYALGGRYYEDNEEDYALILRQFYFTEQLAMVTDMKLYAWVEGPNEWVLIKSFARDTVITTNDWHNDPTHNTLV